MSSPLFKGPSRNEEFSMPRCANPACGKFMVGVRYTVTVGEQKFKVCSFECEKEIKAQMENSKVEVKG